MSDRRGMRCTKRHCSGCHDNFYNSTNMGLNMVNGEPQCWSLKDAKLVRGKDVPIDMRPPYDNLPKSLRPNCYRAKGYVFMKEKAHD